MCKYCENEQKIFNEKSNSGLVIKNNRLIIYKKEEEKNKIISKIKISNCPFCGNDLYDGNQKEYTFEIDSKLPSLNDYLHVCKHSQGYSGTFKRNTDDIIGWELKRQNVDKLRIAKPIKGYITYIEPQRNRDVDNVYSASTRRSAYEASRLVRFAKNTSEVLGNYSNLKDFDILSARLYYGVKDNIIPLVVGVKRLGRKRARNIVKIFGNDLSGVSEKELQQIEGIGPKLAEKIRLFVEN